MSELITEVIYPCRHQLCKCSSVLAAPPLEIVKPIVAIFRFNKVLYLQKKNQGLFIIIASHTV